MLRLLLSLAFAALSFALSGPVRAAPPVTSYPLAHAGDPCDFTSAFAFDREQVLACFRSVPFCPAGGDSASCDRDVQVAHFRAAVEGFSDLRDTYDATAHWRHKLDAVARTDFKSDFDFWLAMADVVNSFKDPHWAYLGPTCYEETVFAMIPLEFGSMVAKVAGRDEQIVYLREPLSFFADEYVTATGIDANAFTGQRVVTINGEPAVPFLRRWAVEGLHQDTDDGINFMMTLLEEGYTLRTGSFNAFPETRSVVLELETPAGTRTRVELPWAFIPDTEFGLPGPPPASTEQFKALCFTPTVKPAATALRAAPLRHTPPKPLALDERLKKRHEWMANLAAKRPGFVSATTPTGYSEVPPGQQNKDITEILPLSDGARTVAYTHDTVAIQLRSDFLQPWEDDLDAGARYACDHADRLILDLRNNGGGFVFQAQDLAHYLNPEGPILRDAVFGFRELAKAPALNELRTLSEMLVSFGFDPCTVGYEAACYARLPSGQAVTDPRWYTQVTLEPRGNAVESLTPLVMFPSIIPPKDYAIPCPGKFTGKNLIVLLNGVNGSAAFFAPERLEGVGTLVVAGGFEREPMTVGRARGGPVVLTSSYQDDADFLTSVTGVRVFLRLPDLPRPVVFTVEQHAFYKPDLKRLYVDQPALGDVHLPFWSTSQATDGAAYRAAVSAVERRALIEPVCRRPRDAESCARYAQCAESALGAAVQRRAITAETAGRTLVDAVSACRAGID